MEDTRQHGQKDRWKAVEGTGGRYRDKQHAAKHTPSANYTITQGVPGEAAYTAYGGVRDFMRCKDPEVIVSGPAETGKTLGALWKLHIIACKYPNVSLVICRKTLTSTYATVLQTFQNKVLSVLGRGAPKPGYDAPVSAYGGEKAQWYDYPNGSRIWVTGMDKSAKVLSAEHDIIYVNQVEELSLAEWEVLTTRATGRAGNMPYAQTMGDINPTYPAHWVYKRESLTLFSSFHHENPLLYDQDTGEITEQGKRTMRVLHALTGVRRTRLLDGLPAQPEGAVYPGWNPLVHLIDSFPIPVDGRRIRVWDFGYTNPCCIHWWYVDADDRAYMYREIYMTNRTVRSHAMHVHRLEKRYIDVEEGAELEEGFFRDEDGFLSTRIGPAENLVRAPNPEAEPVPETTICDHDAEGRATLEECGISTIAADKAVSTGIQKVEERLEPAWDGKPRLFLFRDALVERDPVLDARKKPISTEEEFPAYSWHKAVEGREEKEVPIKKDDHGMDDVRYLVMYLDGDESGSGESFIITPPDIIDTRDTDGW